MVRPAGPPLAASATSPPSAGALGRAVLGGSVLRVLRGDSRGIGSVDGRRMAALAAAGLATAMMTVSCLCVLLAGHAARVGAGIGGTAQPLPPLPTTTAAIVTTAAGVLWSVFVGWIAHLWYPLYVWTVLAYLIHRSGHNGGILSQLWRTATGGKTVPPSSVPTSPSAALPRDQQQDEQQQKRRQQQQNLDQPIDMTGAYRLVSNDNFEAFLAAQGVPWALRSAANRARPLHRITHVGDTVTIRIEGIIESETTYTVGGAPVEGLVRGRLFRDAVTYLTEPKEMGGDGGGPADPRRGDGAPANGNADEGDPDEKKKKKTTNGTADAAVVGIVTCKRAVEDGYTIYVERRLSPCGTKLLMRSRVEFDETDANRGKETVTSTQVFDRVEG
jgi:hypothetical protein